MSNVNQPLSGIKVVELGTHVAVPNVARAMADFGAQVVKVESFKGDEWRMLGRNYRIPTTAEENAIFTAQNSNKEFIALDLKTPEGLEVMDKLIAQADVFISNVRLKALSKMGLDYDSLKEKYPKLICCHFTGFGYEGPDAARPGFDMAAFWARSGAMVDWNNTGDFPLKPVSGVGDAVTANILLSGVLMALLGRERTGKGTLVSSSLYGSAIWYNASGVIVTQDQYNTKGNNDYPKSRYAPVTPFSHVYECSDGEWLIVTVVDYDSNREKMFKLLDMEEYLGEEKFSTLVNAQKNIEEFTYIVIDKFKQKTRDEWGRIFDENNVVYERLVHYKEIAKDPQAWANNYLEEVTFQSGTKVAMPKFPLLFSEYEGSSITPARGIGSETEKILSDLGYTEDQINKMRENKAIN